MSEPLALDEMGPLLDELDRGIERLIASINAVNLQPPMNDPPRALMDTMDWILSQSETDGRRLVAIGERLTSMPVVTEQVTAATGDAESLAFRVDQLLDRHAEVREQLTRPGADANVASLEAATVVVTEMVGALEARVAAMPPGPHDAMVRRNGAAVPVVWIPGTRRLDVHPPAKYKSRQGIAAASLGGVFVLLGAVGAAVR